MTPTSHRSQYLAIAAAAATLVACSGNGQQTSGPSQREPTLLEIACSPTGDAGAADPVVDAQPTDDAQDPVEAQPSGDADVEANPSGDGEADATSEAATCAANATCVACETQQCPEVIAGCDAFVGADRAACVAVVQCVRATSCHQTDLLYCYCGSADPASCFAPSSAAANGACKTQIEAAQRTSDPSAIANLFTDVTTPGGAAMFLMYCDSAACGSECIPYGPQCATSDADASADAQGGAGADGDTDSATATSGSGGAGGSADDSDGAAALGGSESAAP